MLETEKLTNYNLSIDGCNYVLDIIYVVKLFGKKRIPTIREIHHNGIELLPIIKREIVEEIRSYLFKKKNNITT
jgi:hypothetical protein